MSDWGLKERCAIVTMDAKDLARIIRIHERLAQACCAPVFWRAGEDSRHNGTMTFIRTAAEVLGLTNTHVADGLANCRDELGRRCQVGGAYLDPARLIGHHPEMDLVTFQLSDVFLTQVGPRQLAAEVRVWPPSTATEGSPVMFGGYPATYRNERPDGTVDFNFAWFAAKVQSSSSKNVGMVLGISRSISVGSSPITKDIDLGGWSGGPVLRVADEGGIERLELSAIIYEYSAIHEIALAHPLTDLLIDGTFRT